MDRSERYPTDCHEIQVQGFNVSGIYKIRPDDMEPFYVLCDLTTAGGGWTVSAAYSNVSIPKLSPGLPYCEDDEVLFLFGSSLDAIFV